MSIIKLLMTVFNINREHSNGGRIEVLPKQVEPGFTQVVPNHEQKKRSIVSPGGKGPRQTSVASLNAPDVGERAM